MSTSSHTQGLQHVNTAGRLAHDVATQRTYSAGR
jgi:hypothetical protein